ncbi:hypothetical protein [Aureimonas sp. D3]|uniref:hypothetical protein n=1 Tax=Aureimonas sp. D3 TaxID=1638164 RepID=UPI000781E412|nr:hypothetical protein [Aureimonas sp. D3]
MSQTLNTETIKANDDPRWPEVLGLVREFLDRLDGRSPAVCGATIALLAATELSARAESWKDLSQSTAHFIERVCVVGQKMFEDMEENPEEPSNDAQTGAEP